MFFCCVVCFVLSGISTTLFQLHLSHRWGVHKDILTKATYSLQVIFRIQDRYNPYPVSWAISSFLLDSYIPPQEDHVDDVVVPGPGE